MEISGPVRGPARRLAVVWLAAGVGISAGLDWTAQLPSTGARLLTTIILVALTGPVPQRLLDPTPRVAKESPDAAGLDRDFTDMEIERAERALGASL